MARQFTTDDVVEIVNPDIGIVGPYSMCTWVYADSLGVDGNAALSYGDDVSAANEGWSLAVKGDGTLTLLQANGQQVLGASTLSTGNWYHIAARRLGSGVALIQVILDGTQDGSSNTDAPVIQASTVDFRIGQTYDGDAFARAFWEGRLAEVMFWSGVALTDDEFRSAMIGRIPRRDLLKVHMPLGLSSPEVDLSGQGFSGTVTGATVTDHAPVARIFDTVPMLPYGGVAPAVSTPKGPFGHPLIGIFGGPI